MPLSHGGGGVRGEGGGEHLRAFRGKVRGWAREGRTESGGGGGGEERRARGSRIR